ncbi:von Willebrand factor C domain-containing protein 2-like [Ostrea edulis]|uniref:von Willebrand factor C domain-containing protein 2-like n=1 Tax=Ostrea edulis TaxID=37623 RepID=UPI0024AE906D|nr:von Willebrand factor C domain-containing protein 2-like [Ostrea edulis]
MASLTFLSICLFATVFITVSSQDLLSTSTAGCLYHGKYYPVGSFKPSACQPCQCTSSGQAFCAIVDCFFGGCVDAVHNPDHCCPVCPNGRNCKAPDGTIIKHGDTYSTAEMTCQCSSFGTLATCAHKLQPIQVVDPPAAS